MKLKGFAIVFMLVSTLMVAQNPLTIFDHLVGKTWSAEGEWGNGSRFKQDISFSYALDSTLVVVKSKGFTDESQTKYGIRNYGIRQYDKVSETLKFWEFDVFGGCTEGTVVSEGKNLLYHYTYGNTTVTDLWEYVDDNTYNYKVGMLENGEWKQVFLKTQFHKQYRKS